MGRAPETVRLGGDRVPVPALSGPVGGVPGARYPGLNGVTAVRQVDEQLALIAELRSQAANPHPAPVAQRLAMASAVARFRQDRVAAIAGFQQAAGVRNAAERQNRVVLPGGETWRMLFSYGSMARELDAMRDAPGPVNDQVHTGLFNHQTFATEVTTRMRADAVAGAKFSDASLPDFDRVLSFMERDSRIVDLRWMAYMMATTYWESARTVPVQLAATARRPARTIRAWRTMTPADETGRGASYVYGPEVKVQRNGDSATITERDGQQWTVDVTGEHPLTAQARPGANPAVAAAPSYARAPGTEQSYFGRGYVQLTWWYNYASAGFAIGRGLDLLVDPELVKVPEIAYAVMAHGMIYGSSYANRNQLQHFIYGSTCNYAGARAIVNRLDPQAGIVAAARIFEAALGASRQ
jgi:hypothetical protein